MRKIGPLVLVILPLAVCSFASKDSFAQRQGAEGPAAATATGSTAGADGPAAAAVPATTAGSPAGEGSGQGDAAAPQRPTPAAVYNAPPERPSPQGWSVEIGGYVRGDVSKQDRSGVNP